MGLFRRLFGGHSDQGDSYQMQLHLQHPPTPEFAAAHALIAVDATRNVDGIELDYSPKSIIEADRIIGRFHEEGLRANQIGETVFSFGCYVGEVFVRNENCVWKMPSDTRLPDGLKEGNNMMVIEFPNGGVCNPIGKAFKRLELGEGESLSYFYQVFVKECGPR